MTPPALYFILNQQQSEEGPLTIAQINRKLHQGQISGETLCRKQPDSQLHKLHEVLPHLFANHSADRAKLAKLSEDIREYDSRSLIVTGFIAPAFFWMPFYIGTIGILLGITCGAILLFKHNKMIGIGPIAFGIAMGGLMMRGIGP